jgi:hypothetical protein
MIQVMPPLVRRHKECQVENQTYNQKKGSSNSADPL